MSEQRSWKANWAVEREERLAHLAELSGKEHHERFEALNRVSRLLRHSTFRIRLTQAGE